MAVRTGKGPILGAAADWAARSKLGDTTRPVSVVPPPAQQPVAVIPAVDDADYVWLRVPRSSIHVVLAQESHHMSQSQNTTPVATAAAVASNTTVTGTPTIDAVALREGLTGELADLDARRVRVTTALGELDGNGVNNVTRIAVSKGRANTAKAIGKYSLAAGLGAGLLAGGVYAYRLWKATRG